VGPDEFCGGWGIAVGVECLDWTGGQIGNNDTANDVHDVDLTQVD
jgi:formamidase